MTRVCGAMLIVSICLVASGLGNELRFYPQAVKVTRGGLIHTRQFFSAEKGEAGVADLVRQLETVCRSRGSDLQHVAKLNFYTAAVSPFALQAELEKHWPRGKQPSLTVIPTRLPHDALMALDAVIVTSATPTELTRHPDAANLPSNRDILFVSGRAATGELAEATKSTMAELFAVLEQLDSRPRDVVQVKAFLQPMSDWKLVSAAIEESFGDSGLPPVVLVEWTSKSRATEIELIATAPEQRVGNESISFFTPSGDKASPVFSRVARVHADTVIYFNASVGVESETPESEVRSLFRALKETATEAGTDLRHFAKATYYVSDDAVSSMLNQLRPEYYDPARPPAASKVQVQSIGVPHRGLLIDMIAAPSSETP